MDSNHRRLSQLSYSQPHLATLVTAHILKNSSFAFAIAKVDFLSIDAKKNRRFFASILLLFVGQCDRAAAGFRFLEFYNHIDRFCCFLDVVI